MDTVVSKIKKDRKMCFEVLRLTNFFLVNTWMTRRFVLAFICHVYTISSIRGQLWCQKTDSQAQYVHLGGNDSGWTAGGVESGAEPIVALPRLPFRDSPGSSEGGPCGHTRSVGS